LFSFVCPKPRTGILAEKRDEGLRTYVSFVVWVGFVVPALGLLLRVCGIVGGPETPREFAVMALVGVEFAFAAGVDLAARRIEGRRR
jgi:hypothetical protein